MGGELTRAARVSVAIFTSEGIDDKERLNKGANRDCGWAENRPKR
jgi:hypothetical protein